VASRNAQKTRIGDRFELKSRAGAGGMGTVYQAMDRKTDRVVAVKILNVKSVTDVGRFDQEANVLQELRHPGIVRYVDHGLTSHGDPYIAMDWLEGETLEQRLARGKLAPAGAAHLAACVLEALAAAHATGIVHRDVKPSNVFLVGWRLFDARVIDFGVARRVEDPKRYTRKGATVGTPSYTSPEQARGEVNLDGRADIFSFGCVLFECLTGRPPFSGNNAREVLTAICVEDVPLLGERVEKLDPGFGQLVDAMLTQDRRKRPASAAELAAGFRAVAARLGAVEDRSGEDVEARPPRGIGFSEQRALAALLVAFDRVPARGGQAMGLMSLRQGDRMPARRTAGEASANGLAGAAVPSVDDELKILAEQHGHVLGLTDEGAAYFSLRAAAPITDQVPATASLARAVRAKFSRARLALGTGRAMVMGGVLVGDLADHLIELCPAVPGPCRVDAAAARLLPPAGLLPSADGETYRLVEENAAATAEAGFDAPRAVDKRQSPFVGRDRELDDLISLCADCVSTETARAMILTGAVGVGKTRLLRAFVAEARKRDEAAVFFLRGRSEHAATPFALLAPLQGAQAGLGPRAPLVARQAALVEWLGTIVSHRPCVIVCDDLQWADKASLDLLDVALRELRQRPFAVIAAARPELGDQRPTLWAKRAPLKQRLAPLSRSAGQALLAWSAGAGSSELESFVFDRWEGNPYFLGELIESHRFPIGNARDCAPDTVLGVVEPRIAGLSDEARRVLRAGSLFGEHFDFEAVLSLLGLKGRPALEESLVALVDADLVRRVDEPRGLYAFRGRLVREAAFAMLSPADRSLGMARARQWLEEAGKTLPEILLDSAGRPWGGGTERTGLSAQV
jgi:hypothetical protein